MATSDRLIQDGGWDTLYKWLQEARLEANTPLLLELLKLYKHLPITVTLLKQNNCAKDIRQLIKSGDESKKHAPYSSSSNAGCCDRIGEFVLDNIPHDNVVELMDLMYNVVNTYR